MGEIDSVPLPVGHLNGKTLKQDLTNLQGYWRLIGYDPPQCGEVEECNKDLMLFTQNTDNYLTP